MHLAAHQPPLQFLTAINHCPTGTQPQPGQHRTLVNRQSNLPCRTAVQHNTAVPQHSSAAEWRRPVLQSLAAHKVPNVLQPPRVLALLLVVQQVAQVLPDVLVHAALLKIAAEGILHGVRQLIKHGA